MAANHNANIINVSSDAVPIAFIKVPDFFILGVRKKGLPSVKRPNHIALAIVCDKASPDKAVAKASLGVVTILVPKYK